MCLCGFLEKKKMFSPADFVFKDFFLEKSNRRYVVVEVFLDVELGHDRLQVVSDRIMGDIVVGHHPDGLVQIVLQRNLVGKDVIEVGSVDNDDRLPASFVQGMDEIFRKGITGYKD